jgi:replication initiation and membrane attachment protein DnaB
MTNDNRDESFEERFKATHGMTIAEWNAKLEEKFKSETGITPDEWVINRYSSLTPVEILKEYGVISEADVTLVKDLQLIGLNDGVINVLLEYVTIVNGIGFVHSLTLELGKSWLEKDIVTIEKAVDYMREEQRRYKESAES